MGNKIFSQTTAQRELKFKIITRLSERISVARHIFFCLQAKLFAAFTSFEGKQQLENKYVYNLSLFLMCYSEESMCHNTSTQIYPNFQKIYVFILRVYKMYVISHYIPYAFLSFINWGVGLL